MELPPTPKALRQIYNLEIPDHQILENPLKDLIHLQIQLSRLNDTSLSTQQTEELALTIAQLELQIQKLKT